MSYETVEQRMNAALAGQKVVGVSGKECSVTLTLSNGKTHRISLDGDCCSFSYFTDSKQFEELIGSTIQSVEDRYGPSGSSAQESSDISETGSDSVSWHFLVFVTNKGHVTIDWRNDSNGYYDGSVVFSPYDDKNDPLTTNQ